MIQKISYDIEKWSKAEYLSVQFVIFVGGMKN